MRISRMHPAVQRGRLAGLRRHDAAKARKAKAFAQAKAEAKADELLSCGRPKLR